MDDWWRPYIVSFAVVFIIGLWDILKRSISEYGARSGKVGCDTLHLLGYALGRLWARCNRPRQ